MKRHLILFDFDGVIVDSFNTAFMVTKKRHPNITEALYLKGFEGNINNWEIPSYIHTEKCRHDLDFFEEYIPRMKAEVKIVIGMEKVIIELEKFYALVVISSTVTSPIKDFLETHNLTTHFTEIMGNDVHKSKVEKMKMVFEKYNTSPRNCLFITDTLGDMMEAKYLDVPVIGVTWGFHKPKTLLRGDPFRLVEKPEDLLSAISDYFKNDKQSRD